MSDNESNHRDRLERQPHLAGRTPPSTKYETDGDGLEACCAAFGYLRGIRERADAIEFRFRDGNSVWFPYGWLGTWKFDPSEGLLLKFSGDLVYLVLIRGSNLDKPLTDSTINLTSAGLQRHRVLWIREMQDDEIHRVGEAGPTIDGIETAEFETQEALKEWLGRVAPRFVQ